MLNQTETRLFQAVRETLATADKYKVCATAERFFDIGRLLNAP